MGQAVSSGQVVPEIRTVECSSVTRSRTPANNALKPCPSTISENAHVPVCVKNLPKTHKKITKKSPKIHKNVQKKNKKINQKKKKKKKKNHKLPKTQKKKKKKKKK